MYLYSYLYCLALRVVLMACERERREEEKRRETRRGLSAGDLEGTDTTQTHAAADSINTAKEGIEEEFPVKELGEWKR